MFARAVPRLSSLSATRLATAQRCLHSRVPLEFPLEDGVGNFLTAKALKTVAVDWQEGVLDKLNTLTRGTESEASSVLQTLQKTAQSPDQSLQFNYASEALNNSFFLSLLSPTANEPSTSTALYTQIQSTFGSLSGLVSHFSAHVAGLHPSSGAYVWLVTDPAGNLGVVGTYAGGTVLLHQRHQRGPAALAGDRKILGELIDPKPEGEADEAEPEHESVWQAARSGEKRKDGDDGLLTRKPTSASAVSKGMSSSASIGKTLHPLLCLSVHPHCYLEQYGVWGREEYVRNWWAHINWRQVEEMFAEYKAK